MSGHSKWATTKRAKAVTDAKRAGAFTKVANLITIAAREKGGDLDSNFSLRLAIEKARAVNMPKDNIERAINRGLGKIAGETFEEIQYEGYGPGGSAVIIDVLTNNRNRSSSEIKHLLAKYGGSLGAQNSVRWMFDRVGMIGLPSDSLTDDTELSLIEAGAQDIVRGADGITVTTAPDLLAAVKNAVESLGLVPAFTEIDYAPKNPVALPAEHRSSFDKLMDELDDHSDVTATYSNLE